MKAQSKHIKFEIRKKDMKMKFSLNNIRIWDCLNSTIGCSLKSHQQKALIRINFPKEEKKNNIKKTNYSVNISRFLIRLFLHPDSFILIINLHDKLCCYKFPKRGRLLMIFKNFDHKDMWRRKWSSVRSNTFYIPNLSFKQNKIHLLIYCFIIILV